MHTLVLSHLEDILVSSISGIRMSTCKGIYWSFSIFPRYVSRIMVTYYTQISKFWSKCFHCTYIVSKVFGKSYFSRYTLVTLSWRLIGILKWILESLCYFHPFWPTFGLFNIVIWTSSSGEKLFIIEIPFHNILNHPIHMLESKVIVKYWDNIKTVIFMRMVAARRIISWN